MTRVCDIRQLPTMGDLAEWASLRGCPLTYLGPDLQGHAVYAASTGVTTRVAVTPERDPHPLPLVWHSPLEGL